MQIQSLKLSNLLSFPYLENFENSDRIVFCDERTWWVNILIGPNGSGKSNFLEILNQIFKVWLVTDYVYNKQIPMSNSQENIKKTIQINKKNLEYLRKNYMFKDKISKAEITLKLSKNDFDNLAFVCKHNEILNQIIKKYSDFSFFFPAFDIEELKDEAVITFQMDFDIENKQIIVNKNVLSDKQKFILYYMKDFELIQICMDIYNNFEKKPEEKAFYPLKSTFAILWSNRNFEMNEEDYDRFANIDPTSWSDYLTNQSTKSHFLSSLGYFLCLNKATKVSILPPFLPWEQAETKNTNEHVSKFQNELNQIIKFYLDLQLKVIEKDGKYSFWIDEWDWILWDFNALSSGKKSILMIILTIFGYDMENGLMIIDEPELHLHPQYQKLFVKMLNFLSKKYGIQFLIATHSPIMINESNIRNVYRFTKNQYGTIIQAPLKHINENEANLVQMLKFENMSKMFFVDKIIAVEWMTDTYFFDFYLEYLSQTPEWKWKIKEYEILDIQWKWSFKMRKKFLWRFGVQTYFIWDWDNIIENWIISDQELNYYRSVTKQNYKKIKNKSDLWNNRFYTILVQTIKEKFPEKHEYISKSIEKLYQQNVFIFKQWDLETYLWIEYKWLDKIVQFCNEYFQVWLNDAKFDDERKEFDEIFNLIFK